MLAKISLGISIVLAIAVGYLLFRSKGETTYAEVSPVASPSAAAFANPDSVRAPVIAFVDADTLNARYKYLLEMQPILEKKQADFEKKLESMMMAPQMEIQRWYARVEEMGDKITQEEMQMAEQDVQRLQQEMEGIKKREYARFDKEAATYQQELYGKVNAFLDRYSKQKGIDVVMTNQQETHLVLYKNPAYDVTGEVLAGLNAEYVKEKETEEAKK